MVQIPDIASNLRRSPEGIWFAATQTAVSYPEDGSRRHLAVETDSFWFTHRSACILEAVRAFPPRGTIFDVGGGNGVVSLAIERAGLDVVLVEPGAEGARNARSRGIESVICATLEDAGIRRHALPAVGLFDVLEHMDDDVSFLQRTAELVAPGGRLYLTVPAYACLWSAEDEYAGHRRRYRRRSLHRVMRAAGLAVEFGSYFFSPLPLPILLRRTLPSRLGLRGTTRDGRDMREHVAPRGLARSLLDGVLGLELRAIRSRRALPFGGSYLAVGRAPDAGAAASR